MPSATLSRAAAVRTWSHHQGFGDAEERTPRAILAERSWVRTLGGADPYFALFARGAPLDRDAIDAALLRGELRVTPAVRGCMYLVAAEHADLALGVAEHQSAKRNERDLEKAGATAKQIGKTAKAVLAALEAAPQTTAELRKGPVAKAITRFGDRGKKVGLSSSLPPALRQLEFDGAIERTPVDGRLDTETYRWSLRRTTRTRPSPAEAEHQIAALFFAHHGPASLEHFVQWSGLTKKAARAAVADLDLVEVKVSGHGDEPEVMLATASTLEEVGGAKPKTKTKSKSKADGASIALLGLQDLYLVVHDGPGWVCPTEYLGVEIPRWGPMRGGPIGETKHPHLRAVLVGGELVGFWDVDAAMERHVVSWLGGARQVGAKQDKAVDAGVDALRRFMAESLGHAKTFSIDSADKIDARFELVRGLG